MGQADQNSEWQLRVRLLMGQGLGVEDIAVKLDSPAPDVRREAEILEAQGELDQVHRRWRK